MKNEKTMKTLYYKKCNSDNESRRVFVWHSSYICPHCGKGLIELSNQELERQKTKSNESYELFDDIFLDAPYGSGELEDFTCPKCGYIFAIKPGYVYKNEAKSKYDVYEVQWNQASKRLSESLHYDTKNNKFHIFISFVDYIPTRNGLITKTRYLKWIIDLKNHRTYFYDPSPKTIINCTNNFGYEFMYGSDLINSVSSTLWAKLLKYFCHVKGLSSIHRELTKMINFAKKTKLVKKECFVIDGFEKRYTFYIINSLNRIPNAIVSYDEYKQSYKLIFDIYKFVECDYYMNEFIKNNPHDIIDYQTYIKQMIQKFDLPSSKAFWKNYLECPITLQNAMYFQSCGFKNKDVLLKLLKSDVVTKLISSNSGRKESNILIINFRVMLKKMLKVSTEISILNKINRIKDKYVIRDSIEMYNKLKTNKKEYINMIDWSGSFTEIHDELSELLSKIRYENVEIKYGEKDEKLKDSILGYSFDLAKDTNQLVEIGQKMGICVGGYRDYVLRKISKIIHVKRDDKYVGCIELNAEHSLVQAKAKYNNMMTGELAKALKFWVKKKSIKNADKCYDYCHLDEETNRTYDYHALEIDEDGNVVRPGVRHNYAAEDDRVVIEPNERFERELELLDEGWEGPF